MMYIYMCMFISTHTKTYAMYVEINIFNKWFEKSMFTSKTSNIVKIYETLQSGNLQNEVR